MLLYEGKQQPIEIGSLGHVTGVTLARRGVLHYEEQRAGEPAFLVSGLNGLAAPWQAVATMLARRFRVVTHDHLGLGGSGARSGSCSVDAIAADALALMDRRAVSRAHLVGHSLGGAVVQAISADHPERVARLVVYASWPGYDSYFDRVMSALLRDNLGENLRRSG